MPRPAKTGTSTLESLERESVDNAGATPGISAPAMVGVIASKNARHCSAETPGRARRAQFAIVARTSGTVTSAAYRTSRGQSSGALLSITRSSSAKDSPSFPSLPRANWRYQAGKSLPSNAEGGCFVKTNYVGSTHRRVCNTLWEGPGIQA
jgi:hypothetical protein